MAMHALSLGGSPYDVGLQHGKRLREIVVGYYSLCNMILRDIPKENVAETLSKVEGGLRKRYPEALEEMKGIAEGSKLGYEDVLLMNFTSEVRSQRPSRCTMFAATGEATRTGQPIMGKTRDMAAQVYFPFQIAMKVRTSGKPILFLAEAFSGMAVTGCGMNEYGLGLALSTITSISDVDETVGVQRAFLARQILEECRNVEEALDLFSANDLAYQGANFMVCDAKGECFLVEKSHCHQTVVRAENVVIASTNHFTDPKMLDFSKTSGKSSKARLERICSLLSANKGKIDLSLAKTFLRDHANGLDNNSICRHTSSGANTVQAYVLEPVSKQVFISDGHPCLHRFQRYRPF